MNEDETEEKSETPAAVYLLKKQKVKMNQQ